MTGDADDWLITGDANFQETRSSIKKKNVEFRMAFQLPSFNVVHHYKDWLILWSAFFHWKTLNREMG